MVRLTFRAGFLFSLVLAPALAAQTRDDVAWQRGCERNQWDNGDGEVFCEVRYTGFRLTGTNLTVDPDENGGVEVIGWDRDSVAVTLRVQANARTAEDAKALAQKVGVEASGSRVEVTGPSTRRRENWSASLVVWVPRKISLTASTTNGPLAARKLAGSLDLRSTNGPLDLEDLSGDVRARVQNGPLTVELSGSSWEGKGLDAESVNGPVDLMIPDNYNADLETGTVNGPMDTSIPLTVTFQGRMHDRIRSKLGKGGAPVRVVTTNGPLSIRRAR